MFRCSLSSKKSARILAATLLVALPGLALSPAVEAEPKQKPLKASSAKRSKQTAQESKQADVKPTGPLVISVSLNSQHLTVFDGTTAIATSRISSGKIGHSTPTGVYSFSRKSASIIRTSTAVRRCPTCSASRGRGSRSMPALCRGIPLRMGACDCPPASRRSFSG